MDLQEFSCHLTDLIRANRSIYFRVEPEVLDFTTKSSGKLVIGGLRKQIEAEVSPENIRELIGIFDHTIFDPEHVDRLYTWNFKPFSTYVYYLTKKFVDPKNSIIDLKPIEYFLGHRKKRPENLVEAITRLKVTLHNSGWQKIYKDLHLPLILRVLPAIEATPLLHDKFRVPVHPCYEIEGQVNGRMNCYNAYSRGYLPHSMGLDVKQHLKPRGENLRFAVADFRHCEVNVLSWLSRDEVLREIIDSGDDVHQKIYEIITEDVCDTDKKRNLSKRMFLPVMYGCGPRGLSKNLSISESMGTTLYDRIQNRFPTAIEWLDSQEELARKGKFKDFFGRTRIFSENKTYLARNTAVQAVAATVCIEKLLDLYIHLKHARLVFSIHDGYGMICRTSEAKLAYDEVKETLESDSKFCPNLKMKAEIKFGLRLHKTKVLWSD